jgi:hypothetical protein
MRGDIMATIIAARPEASAIGELSASTSSKVPAALGHVTWLAQR